MKKMLAVSKKYLKDDGSPKESGKTREDVQVVERDVLRVAVLL